MDANSGEPWSEMDIADLTYSLAIGNSFADVASMLCRDIAEVRKKARELGLVERPRRVVPRATPHTAITSAIKITKANAAAPRCSRRVMVLHDHGLLA